MDVRFAFSCVRILHEVYLQIFLSLSEILKIGGGENLRLLQSEILLASFSKYVQIVLQKTRNNSTKYNQIKLNMYKNETPKQDCFPVTLFQKPLLDSIYSISNQRISTAHDDE